ncbi:MAG: hypothetical protein ABIM99_02780 [Candidatus Dojkabacteria bacterium]
MDFSNKDTIQNNVSIIETHDLNAEQIMAIIEEVDNSNVVIDSFVIELIENALSIKTGVLMRTLIFLFKLTKTFPNLNLVKGHIFNTENDESNQKFDGETRTNLNAEFITFSENITKELSNNALDFVIAMFYASKEDLQARGETKSWSPDLIRKAQSNQNILYRDMMQKETVFRTVVYTETFFDFPSDLVIPIDDRELNHKILMSLWHLKLSKTDKKFNKNMPVRDIIGLVTDIYRNFINKLKIHISNRDFHSAARLLQNLTSNDGKLFQEVTIFLNNTYLFPKTTDDSENSYKLARTINILDFLRNSIEITLTQSEINLISEINQISDDKIEYRKRLVPLKELSNRINTYNKIPRDLRTHFNFLGNRNA